jgi:hypothetical protein
MRIRKLAVCLTVTVLTITTQIHSVFALPLRGVRVTLQTGNDDLREDSVASLILTSRNGDTRIITLTNPRERLADRTEFTREFSTASGLDTADITDVTLRFRGGSASGLRSRDQWEVRGIRVVAIDSSAGESVLLRAIPNRESRLQIKFERTSDWRVTIPSPANRDPLFFIGSIRTCRNRTFSGFEGGVSFLRFTSLCP